MKPSQNEHLKELARVLSNPERYGHLVTQALLPTEAAGELQQTPPLDTVLRLFPSDVPETARIYQFPDRAV